MNTTLRRAPWADVLFAMDRDWWRVHEREAAAFTGERLSLRVNRHGAVPAGIADCGNSGAGAVALALARGAERVVLLGYDMQHTGGQRHWHGDHPRSLGNAGTVGSWPEHFTRIAQEHGRSVVNCSRETALRCFDRARLEDVLC